MYNGSHGRRKRALSGLLACAVSGPALMARPPRRYVNSLSHVHESLSRSWYRVEGVSSPSHHIRRSRLLSGVPVDQDLDRCLLQGFVMQWVSGTVEILTQLECFMVTWFHTTTSVKLPCSKRGLRVLQALSAFGCAYLSRVGSFAACWCAYNLLFLS